MKQGSKLVFTRGNVLHVIRYGKTSNKKIALPNVPIVQTYHFSRSQFEWTANGGQGWQGLMDAKHTSANCLDCPFRDGTCYTHKPVQSSGFLSMLRSIARQYPTWDDIPAWNRVANPIKVHEFAPYRDAIRKHGYVRFGSYGEPVLLPLSVVRYLAGDAKSWTGYTHAWKNPLYRAYREYFMASTSDADRGKAELMGWREFCAIAPTSEHKPFVPCPASQEAGFKSHCAKCGLCSGTTGKGSKSVAIALH